MSKFDPKILEAARASHGDKPLGSVALRRLIDEVRHPGDEGLGTTAYNRTYHRHNR